MALQKRHLVAAIVVALLSIQPALADKPAHAGPGGGQGKGQSQGKGNGNTHGKQSQAERKTERPSGKAPDRADRPGQADRRDAGTRHDHAYHGDRGGSISIDIHFNDQQRSYLREYYGNEFRAGRCPPGLAKKHNGCMPPGQAKKWQIGYPLDRDIVFYDLPPGVVARIGLPPSGYRYVRVASDILMIAVGTGLVVDAVADLASM
ncbi:RcnB family protein [Pollutimonas sp. M17]|uniref:RcnB family protein n=1 Tax=Pollutimonas sp. M17 TaxID=2962065 RepID=UPI0021F4A25A|nr:RcnB family protein [Pollutimonas sp. M17]UYO94914.1 RcnB family protein [Pollutimonas sp. M17]